MGAESAPTPLATQPLFVSCWVRIITHHSLGRVLTRACSVLTILLPTAFFASLDRGAQSIATTGIAEYSGSLLTDPSRDKILRMSRGLAVVLLLVYVFTSRDLTCTKKLIPIHVTRYVMSRVFLHNPPGEGNALLAAPNAPAEVHDEEHHLEHAEPEINPWVGIILLVITIAIMATTAEFVSGPSEQHAADTHFEDIRSLWRALNLSVKVGTFKKSSYPP